MSGAKGEDATALGFILVFAFMFAIMPMMLITLVIGGIFDIIEFQNKRKK